MRVFLAPRPPALLLPGFSPASQKRAAGRFCCRYRRAQRRPHARAINGRDHNRLRLVHCRRSRPERRPQILVFRRDWRSWRWIFDQCGSGCRSPRRPAGSCARSERAQGRWGRGWAHPTWSGRLCTLGLSGSYFSARRFVRQTDRPLVPRASVLAARRARSPTRADDPGISPVR